jgi:hypothetical protein
VRKSGVLRNNQVHSNTATRGEHECFNRRLSSTNSYINTPRASFYTDVRVQRTHLLCVTECSTSTTVTSEHNIIPALDGNVGVNPASSSTFEPVSSGILLSVSVSYATGYPQYNTVIFRHLFCGAACRWPAPVKQKVWVPQDGAPAHHGEVRRWMNAVYVFRKRGLNVNGRLHGLLVALCKSDGFFSHVETPEAARLPSHSQDYRRCRGKIPGSLCQRSMSMYEDLFQRMLCGVLQSA